MPGEEVLRFRSLLSLSFPPSEIYHIEPEKHAQAPIGMTVAFMGLTGAEGALPRHYTELLLQRAQANDYAFRDFLDLFNHRLISLFYRAWEKHHCVVGFERTQETGEEDRFAKLLYAVLGLGTAGLRERLRGDDAGLLRYAGLLVQRPRSAHALQHCLADAFQVPVRVKQFMGAWLSLQEEDWTRLGTTGANNLLGQTTVAGTKVWDQQARFQVRLGPLDFAIFSRLLPSGKAFPTMIRLTKFMAGPELEFTVHLVLKASEVPPCRLQVTPAYAPRLAWTTWLSSRPRFSNAEDVMFSGEFSTIRTDAA
jgi:type VI secretion system protein ImpH